MLPYTVDDLLSTLVWSTVTFANVLSLCLAKFIISRSESVDPNMTDTALLSKLPVDRIRYQQVICSYSSVEFCKLWDRVAFGRQKAQGSNFSGIYIKVSDISGSNSCKAYIDFRQQDRQQNSSSITLKSKSAKTGTDAI